MLLRKRPQVIFNLLLLVLAGLLLVQTGASAQEKKRKEKVIESPGQPPTLQLTASQNTVSACAGDDSQVRLTATAVSPNGNTIHYKWSTSGGRLNGTGPNPTWDLSGVQPGVYRAIAEIDSGANPGEGCIAFSSVAVLVKECPPPTCPNITIYCPGNVALNQPVTFTANVTGIPAGMTPVYRWTVSAGTIITGQGTTSIQVDTTGLTGQPVTATLDVGGFNLVCNAACTAQVPAAPILPRKFDVVPQVRYNDEKARLDNLAIQLQQEPGSKAYIIVYSGRRDRPGAAQARIKRAKDYLVNTRRIDESRIVTLVAGQSREDQEEELWIVPQGATPPRP